MHLRCVAFWSITLLAFRPAPFVYAQVSGVLTGGYDAGRTNADVSETALNPATVSPAQFGRLFVLPVDGQIYAQPLYLPNVAVAGQGTHNVVFIATLHNSVYAYDADTAGTPLWTVNLGPSVPSTAYDSASGPYTDLTPEIGILGTPTIDPSTGTLYVVAATIENGVYYYRLHALDTTSGAEKFGAPAVIQGVVKGNGVDSVNGVVSFGALQYLQRPGLLFLNGVVYVAFGSHGDDGAWHGWIMGYSAANVQVQTAVFNATPNSYGGAIWNSGRGLSADSQGNIYAVTSNGDTDEITEFSDNVLRLNPSDLTVSDWFAPSNVQMLDDDDGDLGSSGAVVLPGTNLLLAGGKQGVAYLLDSTALGHMIPNNSQIPQSFSAASIGIFNMAVWNRSTGPVLYLLGGNGPVESFPFGGNQFNTANSSQSAVWFGTAFNGITISAAGGNPGSGIVWVTTPDSWPLPASGTLYAFNADDLSQELWDSSLDIGRDALGEFSKFANPTVANGKVYAPTGSGALAVYGQIQASSVSTPVITGIVNGASYANGNLAPGEIVDVFGQNLGPQTLVSGTFDPNGNLSVGIAGTQVTFNGVPAPLLYASGYVVSAIVPFEIAGSNQTAVQVSAGGSNSSLQTFAVAASAPGIFTNDSSGSGQASVLNQDFSLNSATNPAAPGSVIVVYATGGGQTNPAVATGATSSAAQSTASVSATIGGQPARVEYAGQAPGEVAGAMQVNLQVPSGVTGDVPVVLTIGGVPSQATATVAVQ
jgi:uncharacterized protein (TIGR03437 family)